jgi:hypothetical protein
MRDDLNPIKSEFEPGMTCNGLHLHLETAAQLIIPVEIWHRKDSARF